LLGRKDLVQAAWVASAPHHGHGRTMKVGKEEAMAMLAAVEMWVGRDHKAEYQSWENWMNHIAGVVSKTDGVKATVREPEGLSNHTPSLNISWDPAQLGVTGDEVGKELFTTEPRIAIGSNEHGLSITAYMMSAGEEKIVADRISQILSRPRPKMAAPKTPAGDLTGRWDVKIDFVAGSTTHHFYVKQQENKLVGTHQGDFVARDFRGTISGDQVLIASAVGENHGAAMSFRFAGKLDGDKMSGTLDMGEYLGAKWTATRHSF
jgi:L-seryl-tRNA(Ser) seleniumtransferase